MFGAYGAAVGGNSVIFVSQVSDSENSWLRWKFGEIPAQTHLALAHVCVECVTSYQIHPKYQRVRPENWANNIFAQRSTH